MYKAIIAKLSNVREHSNADRIKLATVYGNQVVVGLDHKDGDRGIYFPTDGQLSQEFCDANDLISRKNTETGEREGGFFDHNRRVRTQKFRGEKSEGFWIPLDSISFLGDIRFDLKEGHQFDEMKGVPICNKYITKRTRGSGNPNRNKVRQKDLCPIFYEHSDTDQFMYHVKDILLGSLITITEKLHGTSQRTSYTKVMMELSPFQKFINRFLPIFKDYEWQYRTGTRKVVLDDPSVAHKGGYYGSNDFRMKHHDILVGNLKKGETVYYEVVGWVNPDTPIMPRCKNSKLKDKEFSKKYGDETIFKYGCIPGESAMYVYRISLTNEDGYSIDYTWEGIKNRCKELGLETTPQLRVSMMNDIHHPHDNLIEIVEQLCQGESTIDHGHIREGVVVRVEKGSEFQAYKHKNYNFKVLEGIIKDQSDTVDIEEQEDML